jgi:hypothetical protein
MWPPSFIMPEDRFETNEITSGLPYLLISRGLLAHSLGLSRAVFDNHRLGGFDCVRGIST